MRNNSLVKKKLLKQAIDEVADCDFKEHEICEAVLARYLWLELEESCEKDS